MDKDRETLEYVYNALINIWNDLGDLVQSGKNTEYVGNCINFYLFTLKPLVEYIKEMSPDISYDNAEKERHVNKRLYYTSPYIDPYIEKICDVDNKKGING